MLRVTSRTCRQTSLWVVETWKELNDMTRVQPAFSQHLLARPFFQRILTEPCHEDLNPIHLQTSSSCSRWSHARYLETPAHLFPILSHGSQEAPGNLSIKPDLTDIRQGMKWGLHFLFSKSPYLPEVMFTPHVNTCRPSLDLQSQRTCEV